MKRMTWLSAALVLCVLAAGGLARAVPIADVLALHMDEPWGGFALDATPNANHGTLLYDTARTDDAKFGRALSFDGQGDYVSIPDSPSFDSITSGITIEGWAKVTSDPNVNSNNNYRMIVSKGGRDGVWDLLLEQGRGTAWSVTVDGGGGPVEQRYWPTHPAWPIGDWVHFAYTYDSPTGQMIAYMNGTPYPTTKTAGPIVTDNLPVYLSYPNNSPPSTVGGQGAFPGILDEVAIYSSVLTGAEVLARYNDGPPQPPLPPPPTADTLVLHLDEPSGTIAYDVTSPANDGTLVNGVGRGAGQFGGAVHFDGVDDHIRVPLSAAQSPTSGLTVEGWFLVDQEPNVDGNNNWRWIFNKGGWATPFDCILEQGRNLCYSIKLDGDTAHYRWNTGKLLPLNEWTHVAWTYDGATGMMEVYLNGVGFSHPIGTTGDLATNNSDLYLSWPSGTAFPSGHGAFPGWMDEIAMYSRALTSDEILLRYTDGPPIFPEPATLALVGAGLAFVARRRRPRR